MALKQLFSSKPDVSRAVAVLFCVASVMVCFAYDYWRSVLPDWWRGHGGGIPYVDRCVADQVAAPAGVGRQEDKASTFTVEFVVKSCHEVLPDGNHFRLFSEESFKNKATFVVHLTDNAVAKLGARDLEKAFLGKRVRVSGKLEKIVFSSFFETRPGIFVDDPARIVVVQRAE